MIHILLNGFDFLYYMTWVAPMKLILTGSTKFSNCNKMKFWNVKYKIIIEFSSFIFHGCKQFLKAQVFPIYSSQLKNISHIKHLFIVGRNRRNIAQKNGKYVITGLPLLSDTKVRAIKCRFLIFLWTPLRHAFANLADPSSSFIHSF